MSVAPARRLMAAGVVNLTRDASACSLRAVSDGSATDFDALVRVHRAAMLAFATGLTRDSADAHDLVQDTLERALRYFTTLRPESNARAWLFTILHRRFIDRCRQRRAEMVTSLEDDDVAAPPPSEPGPPPTWTLLEREDLRSAVEALDEPFRVVYRMHALEGRAYTEIAAALGIPTNTVGTRMARARRKLKALLEERASAKERSGT